MLFYKIISLLCIISFIVITNLGCSTKNTSNPKTPQAIEKENTSQNPLYDNNYSIEEYEKQMDKLISKMKIAGEKIKESSNLDDANDVLIKVNDEEITKHTWESYKIMNEIKETNSEKELISSLIKTAVLRSEAIKLNIRPSQNKIDDYIENATMDFDEDIETQAFMDGAEMTKDEYLDQLEETAYYMFQREALREYVEKSDKYDSFEEYTKKLLNKANITFYDSELEKIYKK